MIISRVSLGDRDGRLEEERDRYRREAEEAFSEVERIRRAAAFEIERIKNASAAHLVYSLALPLVMAYWGPRIWEIAQACGKMFEGAFNTDARFSGLEID